MVKVDQHEKYGRYSSELQSMASMKIKLADETYDSPIEAKSFKPVCYIFALNSCAELRAIMNGTYYFHSEH